MIKVLWAYIKVNWHCLVKTHKLHKEDHRVFTIYKSYGPREVACLCGYNKGECFDVALAQIKLFEDQIAK